MDFLTPNLSLSQAVLCGITNLGKYFVNYSMLKAFRKTADSSCDWRLIKKLGLTDTFAFCLYIFLLKTQSPSFVVFCRVSIFDCPKSMPESYATFSLLQLLLTQRKMNKNGRVNLAIIKGSPLSGPFLLLPLSTAISFFGYTRRMCFGCSRESLRVARVWVLKIHLKIIRKGLFNFLFPDTADFYLPSSRK